MKVQKELTRNKIETWNMPLLRMLKQPKKQMRSGRGRSPKQTELWTTMRSEHPLHSWADTTSRVWGKRRFSLHFLLSQWKTALHIFKATIEKKCCSILVRVCGRNFVVWSTLETIYLKPLWYYFQLVTFVYYKRFWRVLKIFDVIFLTFAFAGLGVF